MGIALAAATVIAALILLADISNPDSQGSNARIILFPYVCALGYAAYAFNRALEVGRTVGVTTGVMGDLAVIGGIGRRYRPRGNAAVLLSVAAGALILVLMISGLLNLVFAIVAGGACVGFATALIVRGKRLQALAGPAEADWARHADEMRRQYAEMMAARGETIRGYELGERRRWRAAPLWNQVSLSTTAKVLTVVGGSAYGWEALATTLGTSILAEGRAATLLNFSERRFAVELCAMAAYRGFDVEAVRAPDDLDGVGLLSGFAPDALAGLLADVLHAGEERVDRKGTISDRDILATVCETLGKRPLSIERVRAGLRVIRRAEGAAEGMLIDEEEFDALRTAFGDEMRQRTNLLQAAWDIERQLGSLSGLAHGLGTTNATPATATRDLQVFELRRENEALDNEYVVDLLFQLLLRAFRRSAVVTRPEHTIIVAGADRLRTRHPRDLARLAERTPVRLVYFFEHFGDDARALVGQGGGCAAIMALGNHQDAKEASEFIGHEHTFKVTGLTTSTSSGVTHNEGVSETAGESNSYQWQLFGFLNGDGGRGISRSLGTSRSWGISRGIANSFTDSSSTSEQRVYDLRVEPDEIQKLPETALFCVQVVAGAREVTLADCNPDIAGLPRVERDTPRGALKGAS